VPQRRSCLLLWGNLPFGVRQLCTFQQRHYRQGNKLERNIFSGSLKQCNPFPEISKTL
jgi:hypothetical protein